MTDIAAYRQKQSREARLTWARGILDDPEVQSAARMRRACKTILNHSPTDQHLERLRAQQLLVDLQPQPKQKENSQ